MSSLHSSGGEAGRHRIGARESWVGGNKPITPAAFRQIPGFDQVDSNSLSHYTGQLGVSNKIRTPLVHEWDLDSWVSDPVP